MLLEVSGITKRYPGQDAPVLDDVSFSIDMAQRVGIVGESGSGKTTLARIVARLERADAGSVSFNGARVDFGPAVSAECRPQSRQARAAWLGMQMIFQNPAASFPDSMDIGDAIWEGAAYHPAFARCPKAERQARVAEALEAVGLPASFAKKRAFELSGGECQRAAIARAVIGDAKLVICDEATSALDVTVQARIMRLLESLHAQRGIAFMFISHNMALVQGFCDAVYSVGPYKAL